MARYSVLVTFYDHTEEKEIAQHVALETDDYEEAAAEFESTADIDLDDALVGDEDDEDDDDEEEELDEARA